MGDGYLILYLQYNRKNKTAQFFLTYSNDYVIVLIKEECVAF